MNKLMPVNILLVEDDPGDQKLVKISFNNQKIANNLFIADNGNEALDFLYRRGSYSNEVPRPDLILLDLNMPGMNGREFIKHIKNDEKLRTIPVVILTTSDSDRDILESYNLQASGYIKKPVDITEFREVISAIEQYWFVICKKLPEEI